MFNDWGHLSIAIPVAAQTENTAFRWIQYDYSGGGTDCCDFWALDNVVFPTGGSDSETLVGPPCNNLFDGRINDSQALDCAEPSPSTTRGTPTGASTSM